MDSFGSPDTLDAGRQKRKPKGSLKEDRTLDNLCKGQINLERNKTKSSTTVPRWCEPEIWAETRVP